MKKIDKTDYGKFKNIPHEMRYLKAKSVNQAHSYRHYTDIQKDTCEQMLQILYIIK